MTKLHAKLKFFKDCFEADSHAQTLWDIFSSKVSLHYEIDVDDWNDNGVLTLDAEYADQLAKVLDRYSREKMLVLCHSFVSTEYQPKAFGRTADVRWVTCPCYYFPAELTPDGVKFDSTRGVINPAVKSLLNKNSKHLLDTLENQFENAKHKVAEYSAFKNRVIIDFPYQKINDDEELESHFYVDFKSHFRNKSKQYTDNALGHDFEASFVNGSKLDLTASGLNADLRFDFRNYNFNAPYELSVNELEKIDTQSVRSLFGSELSIVSNRLGSYKKHKPHFKAGNKVFSSDLILCVIPKPNNAQGVLHELEQLIQSQNSFSAPLRELLQEPLDENVPVSLDSSKEKGKYSHIPMPMVLSQPQQRVLDTLDDNSLTVLLGPPGTGKSFTIASLALHEYMKGNSVLVVSQNQHAVDVVRQKLIADFGLDRRLTVATSDKGVSLNVERQIREILQLTYRFNLADYDAVSTRLNKLLLKKKELERQFFALCEEHTKEPESEPEPTPELTNIIDESEAVVSQAEPELSLYEKIIYFFKQSFTNNESDEETDSSDDELLESIKLDIPNLPEGLLNDWYLKTEKWTNDAHLLTSRYINLSYARLAKECASNRDIKNSLSNFSHSLRARTEKEQKKLLAKQNFSDVLKALPLWFASLGNLARTLPLENGLFDVVIFDEATQCDISSCLPAIARAKKTVVVGDPKQLKHFSFLSFAEQELFFKKHGLQKSNLSHNYRGESLVDFALAAVQNSEQVNTLDEHFRSDPQIIAFSNQHFYDESLKVMTQRPKVSEGVINIVRCEGEYTGKVNRIEANAVLEHLRNIVSSQQNLPKNEAHSIGILSFFSSQASYIEEKLFESFTLTELRKHNIRCGTPFSFQGEERDHMLISCAVDASTKNASYIYLNRDDVFNVAVTRARDSQTLFLSCAPNEVSSKSKLKEYLDFYSANSSKVAKSIEIDDEFQDEVCEWLLHHGIEVYKNYHVAGIPIDILAVNSGKSLAIDLIGFEGELKDALPLALYQLLSRAGLSSFLLPHQEWLDEKEELCMALCDALDVEYIPEPEPVELIASDLLSSISLDEDALFRAVYDVSLIEIESKFSALNEPRANNQLSLLVDKYEQFTEVLSRCFNTGEITHSRYLNSFESLMKVTLLNLKQAATVLEVVQGQISLQKHHKSIGVGRELFEERQSLIDEQQSEVSRYLLSNESAIMQMDKTILKLNALKSADEHHKVDMNVSKEILDEMTQKLELYQ